MRKSSAAVSYTHLDVYKRQGQLSRSLAAMIRILDGFQIDFVYLDVLFKIIAVSYIAKFAAQVCQDAGEGSVAVKVELAAKIIIIALSLPVVNALLKLVADIRCV